MSMSTHVEGFIEQTDEYRKMIEVLRACKVAGIQAPDEVYEFFGHDLPPENTWYSSLGERIDLTKSGIANAFSGDMEEGYTVYLSRIPKGVVAIRFTNRF